MNPHFKSIRLKNGDLMACTVTEDSLTLSAIKNRAVLEVLNPVVFNSFKFMDPDGGLVETISMQPLVPMTDSEVFELSTDHIFTVADMRPQAAERYCEFIEHLAQVKLNDGDDMDEEQDQLSIAEEELLEMIKLDTKMIH